MRPETPNHALQRTAPRVTVAAISGLGVFTPSHHCPTSAASFCAPPSQLPRHAPPSLSLGSIGVLAPLSRERSHEDSQRERFLIPSIPMPRLFPVCAELRACSPSDASRSTSAASSAPLPLGFITMPASSTFSSPVVARVSTGRGLSSFVSSMRSVVASFLSSVTRSFPASLSVSRRLFHVSTESNRTPNHALQRTAPRVTVAAISGSDPSRPSVALSSARCRFLRSTTQLPRHAPPSLSLGSLGVSSRLPRTNP